MNRRRAAQLGLAGLASTALAGRAWGLESVRGFGLSIGNSIYSHVPSLPNAKGDADAIDQRLAYVGLETFKLGNMDADSLGRQLSHFAARTEGADVIVIYYSGHGIEAGGENYLLPVDVEIDTPERAAEKLVPVTSLLRPLLGNAGLTLFLGDTCRVNPFGEMAVPVAGTRGLVSSAPENTLLYLAPRGPTPIGKRAVQLVDEPAPAALLSLSGSSLVVAFAASANQFAYDGVSGAHSPFAAALLRHLFTGSQSVAEMFDFVRSDVLASTAGRERPQVWTFGTAE